MLRLWLSIAVFWHPVWALGVQFCSTGDGCVGPRTCCCTDGCDPEREPKDTPECLPCPALCCEDWVTPSERDRTRHLPTSDADDGPGVSHPVFSVVAAAFVQIFDPAPLGNNARRALLCVWTT